MGRRARAPLVPPPLTSGTIGLLRGAAGERRSPSDKAARGRSRPDHLGFAAYSDTLAASRASSLVKCVVSRTILPARTR
jgi:hypothetical protein